MATTTPASSQLRVLECSQVSPPPGSVPDSVVPLTYLDALWLHSPPNERVFFYHYPNSTSHFTQTTLPNLKSSLSLTLQHFYPFAGKIRSAPQSEGRHEIAYSDGDSVPLTVAECLDDFDEISGSHQRGIHVLAPLVAPLPKADGSFLSLLALQVTIFPEHGVAIGITSHHAACDASGTISFLSLWASCCRSGCSAVANAALRSFDRSTAPDPPGMYSFNFNLLRKRSESIKAAMPAVHDKVIAIFTLSADQVKRLKELAMSKNSQGGTDSFHCSTLVVSLAHVWACLVRTKSYAVDRTVYLSLSANCRSSMKPPLAPEYFGNCLHPIIAEAKAGDLVVDAEDGFLAAIKAVGKAIKTYKEEGVRVSLESCMEMVDILRRGAITFVSSTPKFSYYSLMDMGWGRPKQAEFITVARTGAIAMSESREGAGGLEVGLALPKQEMDAFAAHFSHGLERLLRC